MSGESPSPSVLVVDDTLINRMMLEAMLPAAGAGRVALADGGEAALAALEKESFDVLLTDLHMPGMDGIELARKAKAKYPQLKLVLETADDEAIESTKDLFDCAISKPFTPDKLKAILGK